MKIALGLFIGIVLLSTPVLGYDLHQYSADVELFDSVAHYDVNLIFSQYNKSQVLITLDDPKNLVIDTTASCEVSDSILGKEILCNRDSPNFKINLNYDKTGKISENGYFLFRDSIKMPVTTREMILEVRLPEGAGLIEEGDPFLPTNGAVRSDGRRPIVTWRKLGLGKDEAFSISVAYENLWYFNYFAVVIPILIVGIIIIGVLVYKFKPGMSFVLPVLKSDEKIVFEAMMKHGNGVNQKVVVRESGYSKAKVSKVLKSLEERGLVTLERIGRSNKIHFAKNLRKPVSKPKNKEL